MTQEKKTFHDAMSQLLEKKLAELQKDKQLDKLNLHACYLIYGKIFETVLETLQGGEISITNESVNYLSQQYYDGTLIAGRHELDPNIFEKRAKLENIDTKELKIIGALFRGTDFLYPVVEELKKRN